MTDEALDAISKLKQALSSAPVLIHPDYTKPFLVQCDASSSNWTLYPT